MRGAWLAGAWLAGAVLVVAALPTARAGAPAWVARVRAAAVARARAPLDGEALTAARVEAARARTGALPQLRLSERSRLGLDGGYAIALEAGVSVPVWAPEAAADARLTAERLTATRRQLRAERRAELHDALADAAALLAAEARLRALDGLASRLRGAGPSPVVRAPLRLVDVRLLASGRSAQRRRAETLRQALSEALGVPVPGPGETAPAETDPEGARDPLGFGAAQLELARCVAASDSVALARFAAADAGLAGALARARARPHVDLELGSSVQLGTGGQEPSYTARVGLSVRLPPWSAASGAASLAVGAAGLDQSLSARWPNRAPAAAPTPAAVPTPAVAPAPDGAQPEPVGGGDTAVVDPVADAERNVRRQLALLVGQEADLLERRYILLEALSEPRPATLTAAYHATTLTLYLADTDEALGLTRLDAALLCGALPP